MQLKNAVIRYRKKKLGREGRGRKRILLPARTSFPLPLSKRIAFLDLRLAAGYSRTGTFFSAVACAVANRSKGKSNSPTFANIYKPLNIFLDPRELGYDRGLRGDALPQEKLLLLRLGQGHPGQVHRRMAAGRGGVRHRRAWVQREGGGRKDKVERGRERQCYQVCKTFAFAFYFELILSRI